MNNWWTVIVIGRRDTKSAPNIHCQCWRCYFLFSRTRSTQMKCFLRTLAPNFSCCVFSFLLNNLIPIQFVSFAQNIVLFIVQRCENSGFCLPVYVWVKPQISAAKLLSRSKRHVHTQLRISLLVHFWLTILIPTQWIRLLRRSNKFGHTNAGRARGKSFINSVITRRTKIDIEWDEMR